MLQNCNAQRKVLRYCVIVRKALTYFRTVTHLDKL